MIDYYKVLGIKREASADEIKRAYRSRAKTMHPDVNTSGSANKDFALINEAYGILSDPDKKRKYDLRLAYGDYFLVNSVFTHNGSRQHTTAKKHRDPAYRDSSGAHDSGFYNQTGQSSQRNKESYRFNSSIDPVIYNLFFGAGMFIGFLIVFLTIGFVYVRMWPYAFLLMTIPGFILIKEGWKGIARVKKTQKKRGKK